MTGEDKIDRNTRLAADRTLLADERTYAAWVRTGIAALASGLGVHPLLSGLARMWLVKGAGSVLVLFGIFCFVAAVWREKTSGLDADQPDTRRLPMAALIGANALLVLVSIAALIAIWMAKR
jgi:putative membrane protein